MMKNNNSNKFVEKLIYEGSNGYQNEYFATSGRSLFCIEAEIMYFKEMRNFFSNSISHKVMNRNQDLGIYYSNKRVIKKITIK